MTTKKKTILLITILIVMIFTFLSIINFMNGAVSDLNEVHKNISYEEVGTLAPFQVCLPEYIPKNIQKNPQINFYAEGGDSPTKTVVLHFKDIQKKKIMVEILQENDPDTTSLTKNYDEEEINGWIKILIGWERPKINKIEEIDEIKNEILFNARPYEHNNIVWWLFEIIEPMDYEATLTRWHNNGVRYRIYSYLPATEIIKITVSMIDCMQR